MRSVSVLATVTHSVQKKPHSIETTIEHHRKMGIVSALQEISEKPVMHSQTTSKRFEILDPTNSNGTAINLFEQTAPYAEKVTHSPPRPRNSCPRQCLVLAALSLQVGLRWAHIHCMTF